MARFTPPRGYKADDTKKRIQWLAEKTGFELNGGDPDPPENLKGIIENHVGYMHIPMAITGPLHIKGSYADGEIYIPLCTLEGTLVMSMTRGLYLGHLSGGIETRHVKQELSRSPIFVFQEINEPHRFINWVNDHWSQIKQVAESTSRHGKLLRIDSFQIKNSVILDFVYDTAEAAGQNMVTIATHAACQFILQQYEADGKFRYFIESNFNSDKNPASKTVLMGRAHQVVASVTINARHLSRVMRVTARECVEAWRQCSISSHLTGMIGSNMHVANALAALYLATGQDVACVAENAVGIVDFEVKNEDDLQATLTMPSISVGTVGGGTCLKQQKENLKLMGCTGKYSSRKLAEIICACALALEISLGGAIVSDEFAKSHAEFGRK